jgi:hypothetical protein
MSKTASYDELNVRELDNRRSEPYSQYFNKMSLTEGEKNMRIAFSENMEEAILYILALAAIMIENDEVDKEYLTTQLYERYIDVASEYLPVDSYVKQYANEISKQIVAATFLYGANSSIIGEDTKSEGSKDSKVNPNDYYLSNDRAMFISECEANSILNYKEYSDALESGKKTKTWIDVGDKRERKTHLEVGGTTIPIKELFVVGNSLMLFPKDTSQSPSTNEIANCRCSARYS